MAWPLIIGAVAQIGSSIIAANAQDSAQDTANKKRQEVLNRIDALQVPDIEKEKIAFEEFKSQGILTPELEQAIATPESELAGIETDSRLREAQFGGLEALQDIANRGGLSESDVARQEEAQRDIDLAAAGRRGAVEQGLRRRGLSGSGLELQGVLQSEATAADQAARAGQFLTGSAQDRALQALIQSGQLGGNIRGQEFGEQSQVAQAQDAIARFNAQQRANVQQRNVGRSNQAQQSNLADKQRLHETNIGRQENIQKYNTGLGQQQFQNQIAKVGAASGALGNQATAASQAGQQKAENLANIGTGISQIGQAYYKANKKKEVK